MDEMSNGQTYCTSLLLLKIQQQQPLLLLVPLLRLLLQTTREKEDKKHTTWQNHRLAKTQLIWWCWYMKNDDAFETMTVLFFLLLFAFFPRSHTHTPVWMLQIFRFHVAANTFPGPIAVWQTKKNELNHSNKFFFSLSLFALYPENDDHANDQRLVNFFSFSPSTIAISVATAAAATAYHFTVFSTFHWCRCYCWCCCCCCFSPLFPPCLSHSFTHSQSIIHKKIFWHRQSMSFDVSVFVCSCLCVFELCAHTHTHANTSETRHFVLCHQFMWPKIVQQQRYTVVE